MALSVVDLYAKVLPKTNCRDCGFPTCLAFASMVVSEQHPLRNCPHLDGEVLAAAEIELAAQYAEGRWLKRDLAAEALKWARERAASLAVTDLPGRIGGTLIERGGEQGLELPYFRDRLRIFGTELSLAGGRDLGRYEQVFILNHLAQGGSSPPRGTWKGFVEFPNTVSKQVSMREQVEHPLVERFSGRVDELRRRAVDLGGEPFAGNEGGADAAFLFTPLPRVPVVLLFWDSAGEDLPAQARLLFDETVTEHLDLESIVFLSERLRQLLCA